MPRGQEEHRQPGMLGYAGLIATTPTTRHTRKDSPQPSISEPRALRAALSVHGCVIFHCEVDHVLWSTTIWQQWVVHFLPIVNHAAFTWRLVFLILRVLFNVLGPDEIS